MKKYLNSFSIRDWAMEDRPREKLLSKGIGSLSNAELIAILIGSGTRNESAVDLAKKILRNSSNNLYELGRTDLQELMKNKGIGNAKALAIMAAMELGRRRKESGLPEREKVNGSHEVFRLFHPLLNDLPHEEFWALLLNRANRVIEKFRVSQGGISGTVIDIRIIMKRSLEKLCSSLILCHNHPSGNLRPSEADIKITGKLKNASALMDIQLIDHLIVADNSYFSFADEGMI